ncbi:MAG: hypothetical protein ACI9TK_000724 [Flavobacteriaceae bacterium]|jgi:hypothetical protein|tara:strand:+ start:40 stop:390 length:351 start_codon:yes stop_codon:yes gene_type:complete
MIIEFEALNRSEIDEVLELLFIASLMIISPRPETLIVFIVKLLPKFKYPSITLVLIVASPFCTVINIGSDVESTDQLVPLVPVCPVEDKIKFCASQKKEAHPKRKQKSAFFIVVII